MLEISILIALWIPIIQLHLEMRRTGPTEWVSIDTMAVLVARAYRVSDRVFGSRLFSLRAFVVSVCFSAFYFVAAFAIAYYGSGADTKSELFKIVDFNLSEISWFSATAFALFIVLDFLSVVQTRFLLRLPRVNSSPKFIAFILFADILFSAFFSVVMVFLLYSVVGLVNCYELDRCNVEALAVPFVHAAYSLDSIFQSVASGFNSYTVFIVLETSDPTIPVGKVDSSELQRIIQSQLSSGTRILYLFPFTTFLASTFMTSVWTWVYIFAIAIVRMILLESRLSAAVGRIRVPSRVVLYMGVAISVIVFAL